MTLAQLSLHQNAHITALHQQGAERRRMLDLGLVPGTQIRVEMDNPLGDPRAYLVRGTLIALRNQQAKQIEVQLIEESAE